MDDPTGLTTQLLSLGPTSAVIAVGFAVAALSGGALPRRKPRLFGRGFLILDVVIVTGVVATMTGQIMVEVLVGALSKALVLGYGLTRRGVLRLALVGLALGSFANFAVIIANGAMPFDDGDGTLTVSAADRDRYEPITDSTSLPWLADIVPVPGFGGLASPGDVVLWISLGVGIVALAHASDGKGGTGWQPSSWWYHARFVMAMNINDWTGALRAARSGLHAWPNDMRLRWDGLTVAMVVGDFRSAADGALDALADPELPEEARGRFLDGYAEALLMDGDPGTLGAAEKALCEAESLLPGDSRLLTSRGLLALRRGDLHGAAASARLVLGRKAPNEHPRARMVLLDTWLEQYRTDGRAAPHLLDLLQGLVADPGIHPGAHYVCWLAAYHSHAGDHAAATKVLHDAAKWTADMDEAAALRYHLAYVLARSADVTCVPEIDRLLDGLPPDYPSAPARAHTTALRHLTAADGHAALTAASRALESDALAPAEAAEVHLTKAIALAALGRHPEAAQSRSEASQHAPHHQLLDLVRT